VKVLVVGAGAVGSLFGARLARAGHEVTLVARAEQVRAIRERGLKVLNDPEEIVPVDAETAVTPAAAASALVLLTVKSFDLDSAATALARAVVRPVPTLLPQNGLGIESIAQTGLAAGGWTEPARWTVRAVHSVPATWVAPGVVRAAGSGEVILPELSRPHVRAFVELLTGAGFVVRTVTDFDREVWRKALVNAAINPLSAVNGVPNGRLLEEPLRGDALRLIGEAVQAARSAGFEFSEEEVVRDFERVARATAENRSSMLQDLDRGRPTEVETISGELLRVASAHGLELPATGAIVAEVRRRVEARSHRPQPS
jgi:2-dehydropantoate 2-reductase